MSRHPNRSIENVSRRDALRGLVGTGLALGVPLTAGVSMADMLAGQAQAGEGAWNPSVYVSIEEDGRVKIICHRSEMGQGIRTGLPQVLADELGADWEKVEIVQALGDAKYGSQNTDGSRSIRRFYQAMREAGAVARTMLEEAAARRWRVNASDCKASGHEVIHTPSGRRSAFGELVAIARDLPIPQASAVTLKDRKDFDYIGQPLPIVDMKKIVTGHTEFGADVVRPGMKVAVIARCPVLFGTVKNVDDRAALNVPGVEQIVTLDAPSAPAAFKPLGGVAVIARDTWSAIKGREALTIEWDEGANAAYSSPAYQEALRAACQEPGVVMRNHGDVEAAFSEAADRHEADYDVPHLSQAPMEPPMATADVRDGSCEVWASTQTPQSARRAVAQALGLEETAVKVHVTLLGGGFGRKSKPDFIVEAALLSRAVGAPVKVVWTREDDIRHGYFHSVSAQKIKASLDAEGRVTGWLHRSAFPSISTTFNPAATHGSAGEFGQGITDLPFAIPNIRSEAGEARGHVRIGWLRSVANIYHAFAIGSFVDELAHKTGRDPKDFLLDLIGPARRVDLAAVGVAEPWNYGEPIETYPEDTGRLRAVIELACDKAGWGRSLPEGRGLGLAAHYSFLTYVAVVTEVVVAEDGTMTIPKVHMAVDCGTVVNPDRVRSQMEGAAVYAASCALNGKITAANGAIEQGNFDDYIVARQYDAPLDVSVHLVENEALPTGVGEPGVPPFIPSLTNAIFAATGKRIRRLPIENQLSGAT